MVGVRSLRAARIVRGSLRCVDEVNCSRVEMVNCTRTQSALLPRIARTITRPSKKSSGMCACSRANTSAIPPAKTRCVIPRGFGGRTTVRRDGAFSDLDWISECALRWACALFGGRVRHDAFAVIAEHFRAGTRVRLDFHYLRKCAIPRPACRQSWQPPASAFAP